MEFADIVVKESPGLCRCCLSEGCYKDMSTEYSWLNENEVYAEMLLECLDISISQHNEGPNGASRLICEVCITRLRDACYFKKQVLDSEKKFVDMVGRREFKCNVIQIEPFQSEIKSESEEVGADIAEVEYLEDDMEFIDEDAMPKPDDIDPSGSEVTAVPLPVRNKRGRPKKSTVVKPEKKKVKTEPKTKNKAVVKEYVVKILMIENHHEPTTTNTNHHQPPSPTRPTLSHEHKEKIHLPSFSDKNDSGKTKRKRCKHCWQTNKQRKASLFYCPDCPESPGFCLEPCFKLFHKY